MGAQHGLDGAYSGNRGYWYFGAPPDTAETAIFVGDEPEIIRPYFDSVRRVSEVDNGLGINNAMQGTPIWVADGQHVAWSQLWPQLRRM